LELRTKTTALISGAQWKRLEFINKTTQIDRCLVYHAARIWNSEQALNFVHPRREFGIANKKDCSVFSRAATNLEFTKQLKSRKKRKCSWKRIATFWPLWSVQWECASKMDTTVCLLPKFS
jgi:hypothetical protein